MSLTQNSKITASDITNALAEKQDALGYTPVKSVNGTNADSSGNVTISTGGLTTSSNITVTASTQGNISPSLSFSNGSDSLGTLNVNSLNVKTGISAGTYTLQNLLQQLVNRSHNHQNETKSIAMNCHQCFTCCD